MLTHHRHRQRTLSFLITMITFVIALDVFLIMGPLVSQETALLYALLVAIGLAVAYQGYNYRHSHEPHVLINTLTQMYLGTILFVAGVLMLILHMFAGMDIVDAYLILSLLVLLLTFLSLGLFEEYLQDHVGRKFGASTPPKKKRGRS